MNLCYTTRDTAFKILSKMSQEQAAAAVIIALIPQKNKSRKKRQKGWKINNLMIL